MNCRECGKQIPEGSAFCLHCGARVTSAAPVPDEEVINAPTPIQQVQQQIRAKTTLPPSVTWEYCQVADVPKPGAPEHEEALLCFFSDNTTIKFPSGEVLAVINELGVKGWELVNITVVRDVRWPSADARSSLSYIAESALRSVPMGPAYVYESSAIGLVYFFKRAKRS